MKKNSLMKTKTTNNKSYIGVDLSLTSPAICVFQGTTFDINSCQFFFLTDKKKYEQTIPQIQGTLFPFYSCEQERYNNIANWILAKVNEFNTDHVFIEDYSFGSTGRVFNIAENCGLLKHKLWDSKIPFTTIPPTVIKKYATGKGNANKEALQTHFIQKTNLDIKATLGMTDKQWNPSSDIIDSYFICGCGYELEDNRQLHSGN